MMIRHYCGNGPNRWIVYTEDDGKRVVVAECNEEAEARLIVVAPTLLLALKDSMEFGIESFEEGYLEMLIDQTEGQKSEASND